MVVESDAVVAIQSLTSNKPQPQWLSWTMVFYVINLASNFDSRSFQYIPREINDSADLFAKWSCEKSMTGFGILGEAPPCGCQVSS